MARRAKLTAQACLEAIGQWFETDLACTFESGHVVVGAGGIWVEFINVTSRIDGQVDPFVGGLLFPREPRDLDDILADDALVMTLHLSDPTPTRRESGGAIILERPIPWRTLVLMSAPGAVLAARCRIVDPELGVRRTWPFAS